MNNRYLCNPMKRIILITGGARSGKSGYAEKLALSLSDAPVYLATARIWDEEFRERVRKISAKYPYLVCEKAGKIIGYVYAGRYSPRDAYNWTVTTSIYVDHECRRCGAGKLLYRALEEKLRERGIVTLLAGIGYCEEEDEYLTHDSVRFHEKEGYEQVAWMKGVGKKFDRWYDLLWMEKKLK